jgi:hypothetical protein
MHAHSMDFGMFATISWQLIMDIHSTLVCGSYVISSLKCHVVGYEFPFTKEWCAAWGVYVLRNASSNNCVNTPIMLGDNISILKDQMPLLSGIEFDFLFSL